ncbi:MULTISPECIES: tRNA 2-selenouridine(34) synthase MnmH [unclassified Halomonas]|uniref:tRNA 2-selenouridine(34) synthase MnmH n=1 Tax=unclassified Halomonas TaxID=2609666 RepID=UPI0006DA47F5|nr:MULTISPECIES: tRNA 2-selenouridine(34) synthase MnmH [unclassified Halomonas]KPQ21029.1 MAG: tRNA 2-selenouridine synthase [Halomonas sp. HL-93]SBR51748.1 tRNA 2-selenouridine synthase [Halomonas sp. HL-93]SNY97496.1 tRNA 2-selenouridine synthase [Halomonas sp. hl-4]
MNLPTVPADTRLIQKECPLIDVRAPVEFAKGALPGAVNLPLMVDDERHQVGIAYQEQGQQAAIALGNDLVNGTVKEARVAAWRDYVSHHPEAIIYCFRGGLRSQIAQQWLADTGLVRPRIAGGWKALRQRLIAQIDVAAQQPLLVVAGLTGCAKTVLINRLANGVDLEGFAQHKGSAFGRSPEPPPCQIDFEHRLSKRLLALPGPLVVEDESRQIGEVNVPLSFWETMACAIRIRVEMPLDWRLEQLQRDYILDLEHAYQLRYGPEEGWQRMCQQLSNALIRLKKRLGSARLQRLQRLQSLAFTAHEHGNPQAHEAWLAPLLTEYYDPMYRYHLQRQRDAGVLEYHAGDWESCLAAARQWSLDQAAVH